MHQEQQPRRGLLATLRGLFGGNIAAEEREPALPPAPPRQPPRRPAPIEPAQPAYRLRDDFLTPTEADFFGALREATDGRWLVMSKVRLADLVHPPGGREWQAAWNKISRKHVDFVLCDPATVQPLVVIELDDRSRRRADRVERDAFVDRVFADANLPLLHVPVRRAYDPRALRSLMLESLGLPNTEAATEVGPAPRVVTRTETRRCERCGGEMRRRVAKRGQHAGAEFWGCANYPRCRHIVPLS